MAHEVWLSTLEDERLDVYARLSERQLQSRLDETRSTVIAESRLVVEVALESGAQPRSFLVDERDLEASRDVLARAAAEVPAYVLPHEQIARLTGFRLTRGLLCALRRPPGRTVAEVVAGTRRVALLEDLVDVANVGALFRSAAALGADAAILSPRCADPLSRRAARVSMGCAFKLPWARAAAADWPCATFDLMRREGFSVYAMALEPDAIPLDDPRLLAAEKRALVFGGEGPGLARATIEACDASVIIPMAASVDSLNVAASSAVAFWQLFR